MAGPILGKKAQTEVTHTIGDLLIAAVVTFILAGIAITILVSMNTQSKKDFEYLAEKIQSVADPGNKIDFDTTIASLQKGKAIVGFDYGVEAITDANNGWSLTNPCSIPESACICWIDKLDYDKATKTFSAAKSDCLSLDTANLKIGVVGNETGGFVFAKEVPASGGMTLNTLGGDAKTKVHVIGLQNMGPIGDHYYVVLCSSLGDNGKCTTEDEFRHAIASLGRKECLSIGSCAGYKNETACRGDVCAVEGDCYPVISPYFIKCDQCDPDTSACGNFLDKKTCEENPCSLRCVWDKYACYPKISTDDLCSNAQKCDDYTGKTYTGCLKNSCGLQAKCFPTRIELNCRDCANMAAEDGCMNFRDEIACTSNPCGLDCMWDGYACFPRASQADICSKVRSCNDYTDKSALACLKNTCGISSTCYPFISSGIYFTNCISCSDIPSGLDYSGNVFDQCSVFDKSFCQNNPCGLSCAWQNDQCVGFKIPEAVT